MPTMKNTVVKSVSPKSVFDSCENLVDATIDWNQGDFLVLDASAHLLKAVSGSAEDGANFCGIARCTIADGKVLSPYQGTDVDAAQGFAALAGPVYGVEAKCIAKTGDAFVSGCPVYVSAETSTRGVTSTAGSKKVIGVYGGPTVASATAGQEIVCLIGAVYPNADCHF